MEKFKLPHEVQKWRVRKGIKKNKSSKSKKRFQNILKKDRNVLPFGSRPKSVSLQDNFKDVVTVGSANGIGSNGVPRKKKNIEFAVSETSDEYSDESYASSETSNSLVEAKSNEDICPLVVEMKDSSAHRKLPGFLQKFDSESEDLDAAVKLFYESIMGSSKVGDAVYGAEDLSGTDKESIETDQMTDISSIYEEEKVEEPFSVHELPSKNQFLVFMRHPYCIYFKGKLCITVLKGSIEVLGCVMDSCTSVRQTIYSPRGSSMLSIETCYADLPTSDDYEALAKRFEDLKLAVSFSKHIISEIENRSCVVLIEVPTPSLFELYLKTLIPEMQLFSVSRYDVNASYKRQYSPLYDTENSLKCTFELPNSSVFKHYKKNHQWERTTEMIIRNSEPGMRTVICGGKGVGKSTFLRFLVNRTLPVFREVLCLDFDPGQSEFNVPGSVSAVLIKQPLLGPNFTHIIEPECMVNVGEINIAQCPHFYLDSIRYIIDYCNSKPELQKLPWIINTMGFSSGIGVDLTVSLIRFVSPHHVLQIESEKAKLNFPTHLTTGYVWQYNSRFCSTPSNFLKYSLIVMDSCVESHKKAPSSNLWGLEPARIREAMVLAYLSQMLKSPAETLTDIVPYRTSYTNLILGVCHTTYPHSMILDALNGNLVALCVYSGNDVLVSNDPAHPRILRKPALCPCLGFGVVRGIDPVEKNLFLLTPLSETQLSKVNCLLLGAVTLPSYVYTMPQGVTGHVPYVSTGPGQPTGKIAKRLFRPMQVYKDRKW